MTEPAQLPYFIGIDPAVGDDWAAETAFQRRPDGTLELVSWRLLPPEGKRIDLPSVKS